MLTQTRTLSKKKKSHTHKKEKNVRARQIPRRTLEREKVRGIYIYMCILPKKKRTKKEGSATENSERRGCVVLINEDSRGVKTAETHAGTHDNTSTHAAL